MLKPGTQVDRYVIEAEIGRGGMAVVYRVRHQSLGSLHALKVLFLPSPSLHERVVLEGRLQASFRHPNVVAVTDVIDVNGAYGLIMDLVDGPALETWLERKNPSLDQRLTLFREIVRGVRAAHEQGIVHRDLKPANVLVTFRDGRCTPMITDFGLAKALGAIGPTVTRSNVSMGTPSYMAPEQIRDAKNVDERADIFSLGAILYRMVCDRPAFDGDDVLSILYATTSGRYTPPRSVKPELPEEVARAIDGCLAPKKEARIPSCDALLATLDGVFVPVACGPTVPAPLGESSADPPVAQPTLTPQASLVDLPAPPPRSSASPAPPETLDSVHIESATPLSLLRRHALSLGVGALLLAVLIVLLRGEGTPEGEGQTPAVETVQQERKPAVVDLSPVDVVSPPTPPSAPTATPVASAPALATTAAPSRAETSTPRVPARGRVSAQGDAQEVWLEGTDGKVALSGETSVTPGSYRVFARFSGADRVPAGEISVVAGEALSLSCNEAFLRCRVSP